MTDRLYYRDPYLHAFDGTIERVERRGDLVAVTLDRTAFYPTSGGQPFDTGVLGSCRVVRVVDDEDDRRISSRLAQTPRIQPRARHRREWRGRLTRRFDHIVAAHRPARAPRRSAGYASAP